MKLTELIHVINAVLEHERRPADIDVVITTELPYMTCGQRPCTGVKDVSMGFDWEAGQFRITPEEKLMCCKHDAPQKVIEWHESYCCPKCEHILSGKRKDRAIRFCSSCGQAVKWDES